MKKATIPVVVLLSAALISGHLYGQDTKAQEDLAAAQPANTKAAATASADKAFSHEAAASKINARAIKDFRSRFAKVGDEHWQLIDKGYCASFVKDGFKTNAYYDLKGHWVASLKYCDESQLPPSIRDVVRRTYYDLAITFVNIVELPEHTAYIVHLEDKKTLKIVRLNEDGEMDVLNEFTKM
jgi:hypothetical protein